MHCNHFEELPTFVEDSILDMAQKFVEDDFPEKIDLSIGAYRDDYGNPYIFKTVAQAEKEVLEDPKCNKEYIPTDGIHALAELSKKLMFGDTAAYAEDRICTSQSLSGAGALRLCAEFLKVSLPHIKSAYVSSPTWGPHYGLFGLCGLDVKPYPYYNKETRSIEVDKMCEFLSKIEKKSIVILHTCAHNPTGSDMSVEDWDKVIETLKKVDCLAMMDTAYPGFVTGDVGNDIIALKKMADSGLDFFVAQSYSKNFGLYGERIGMIHVVCKNSKSAKQVKNNLKYVARNLYSTPPCHGAFIVQNILSDPAKIASWKDELDYAAKRIERTRHMILDGLTNKGTPGDWSHIVKQKGMFCFTGLTEKQAQKMIKTFHIYMLENGRISVAGLNASNIDYFVDCFDACVKSGSD